MPSSELLEATGKPGLGRFPVNVDGYFFTKSPMVVYVAGEQSHVPLLAGWNSEESGFRAILGQDRPTKENFTKAIQKLYAGKAEEVLKVYNPLTDDEVEQVATDLAGDRFIGYGTWKWIDMQSKTGGKPVYRYMYSRPRPAMRAEMGNATAGLAGGIIRDTAASRAPRPAGPKGASHSAEIEYALGNLSTNRVYDWQPEDYKVSEIMQAYFANFIKTGNPNGLGVPLWPPINSKAVSIMNIDVNTRVEAEKNRGRYLFIEQSTGK
jgi:para-nitrobenzyl esterase